MSTTKKKAKRKVEREPVTPISKTISNSELREFVGKVPNLLKIDSININNDKWRINVWTEEFKDGRLMATYTIVKSFFVKYDEGVIYDETIEPSINPNTNLSFYLLVRIFHYLFNKHGACPTIVLFKGVKQLTSCTRAIYKQLRFSHVDLY